MSPLSRTSRGLAIAAVGSVAAFGAVAPAQAAVTSVVKASCKYPLVGVQPLDLTVVADVPDTWPIDQATERLPIRIAATAGGNTSDLIRNVKAYSVEGEWSARSSLHPPSGFVQDVLVPLTVDTWARVGAAIPSPFVLNASGSTPELTFDELGNTGVFLDGLTMNLSAYDEAGTPIDVKKITTDINGVRLEDSDGDRYTFDVSCKLVDGDGVKLDRVELASIDVGYPQIIEYPPAVPSDLKVEPSENGATLSWTAPTSPGTFVGYEVTVNGKTTGVKGTSATVSGLTPDTPYTASVIAIDDGGAKTDPVTGVFRTLKTTSGGDPVRFRFDLAGSTQIRTLVKGQLPLAGTLDGTAALADGAFTADLSLKPTQGRLIALGFIPVTAKVGFVTNGKTAGQIGPNGLTSKSLVRIKLPEVKLFGAVPLAGGNNCQTRQLSTITLSSPGPFFLSERSTLTGTYAISDLNGCGVLNGLVSPLTAGGGNTINLTLEPTALSGR